MSNPYKNYVKIKNNLCIGYYGNCKEYLIQLKYLRPIIEKQLNGLKLILSCKKEDVYLLDCDVILENEIKDKKNTYSKFTELKCNLKDHPIQQLLEESNIDYKFNINLNIKNKNCLISPYSDGSITKSLNNKQIDNLKNMLIDKGFNVEIGQVFKGHGWVIGVENVALFEAAFNNTKTSLCPTGIGTDFYKKLFPEAEVINLKKFNI